MFDEPPTTTETSAPVIQWKGQWQEGIILTLADMAKNMWNAGLVDSKGIHLSALKDGWDSNGIMMMLIFNLPIGIILSR